MILSQEEKEYFQLFNDMIVALYADNTVEPLKDTVSYTHLTLPTTPYV